MNPLEAIEQYLLNPIHGNGNKMTDLKVQLINEKFPYSDIYKKRLFFGYDRAGSIIVKGDGVKNRFIANMVT